MTTHTIPRSALRTLLICAFRYALERRGPAAGEVAGLIRAHHLALTAHDLRAIVDDIQHALEYGLARHEQPWRELVAWVHSTPMVERMR